MNRKPFGVHYALVRRETCACGGVIVVAEHATDRDIQLAVLQHVKTAPHALWSARRWFPDVFAGVDVDAEEVAR